MNKKYLYIQTIGCQMNVYDAERMAGVLKPLGYELTPFLESADLIITNTCTIREKAEQKVFSFLGRLDKMKAERPGLIIAVGGCVAQQEGKNIVRRAPYVDLVFGTHAIGRLPLLIEKVLKSRRPIIDIELSDIMDENEFAFKSESDYGISRFVTIMQGCDNFCTYCVVPYVRGREMSRSPDSILKEIRELVSSGVREITLLGQNVNSYGKKEGLCSFAELLRKVSEIKELARIRFTTSHPKDLSEELMFAFRDIDKLCKHIHLPVQSGSDQILKRMNRGYTRREYREKIEQLRRICPDIAISSDMIVGFPGETRKDFEDTLDLMCKVAYDSLFAFKYSDRPLAPARKFSDKVPEQEKEARLEELLELQEQYTLDKHWKMIGKCEWVLTDGLSRKSEKSGQIQWTGRTHDHKIVNFICEDKDFSGRSLKGEMVLIRIEEAHSHSLKGKLLKIRETEGYAA